MNSFSAQAFLLRVPRNTAGIASLTAQHPQAITAQVQPTRTDSDLKAVLRLETTHLLETSVSGVS